MKRSGAIIPAAAILQGDCRRRGAPPIGAMILDTAVRLPLASRAERDRQRKPCPGAETGVPDKRIE